MSGLSFITDNFIVNAATDNFVFNYFVPQPKGYVESATDKVKALGLVVYDAASYCASTVKTCAPAALGLNSVACLGGAYVTYQNGEFNKAKILAGVGVTSAVTAAVLFARS